MIYAELQGQRRRAGLPLSVEDGMIASICLDRGAALATRNTKDFEGLGLDLVNPWVASQ
jgi:predicted nucleic acid-binding protein